MNTCGALMTLTVFLLCAQAPRAASRQQDAETAALAAAARARADVIVAWSEAGYEIAFAEDQFLTFKGQRALAMMHIAMHDALNSIVPLYRRYAFRGPPVVADPVAAAAQAAHDVLLSQYPDQQEKLASTLDTTLQQGLPGALRDRGIELGRATAAAIIALRQNDGFDVPGTYEFRSGPGEYQTTPPWNGFVVQPGFRFAKPFVLDRPDRYRPPPPPPLTSEMYANAVREIAAAGAINSTTRTDDQTAYAIWWMEFAEGSVNRLARTLTRERHLNLWAAARMFAGIGIALYDSYVAVWDAKYTYNHWRPYTAIRAADTDDNPGTVPDPAWEPLRPTPPHPEYVSAHAAGCAASFGVLESVLGDSVSFTMQTTTAPPDMPTRSFASFRAAAMECADSRVRIGFHYRNSTDAGLALGSQVARQALQTLRPHHRGR